MASRSPKVLKLIIFLLLLVSPAMVQAVTPPVPAHPSQYVVDLAEVLNAGTRTELNARLKDLEAATTVQVVVLTLNSLEGEPIENFSHQTAVKWRIGQKGKDNGVLITVAVKDRKYRIEVGYGLESTLPDSLAGSIGRQYLVPNFRKGDFAGGIVAAVNEIIKIVSKKGEAVAGGAGGPTATSTTETPSRYKTNPLTLILLVVFAILALPILISFLVRKWLGQRTGTDSGFWYGGGGGWSSGGGDSGGFSGGGGDFGGGGASGDW